MDINSITKEEPKSLTDGIRSMLAKRGIVPELMDHHQLIEEIDRVIIEIEKFQELFVAAVSSHIETSFHS